MQNKQTGSFSSIWTLSISNIISTNLHLNAALYTHTHRDFYLFLFYASRAPYVLFQHSLVFGEVVIHVIHLFVRMATNHLFFHCSQHELK